MYRKSGQDYDKAISYMNEAIMIYERNLIEDTRIGLALTQAIREKLQAHRMTLLRKMS